MSNCENLFKWFITDNQSGYKTKESWLKKHKPMLYDNIIENSIDKNILFIEKILLYLGNIRELPKCLICGKTCKNKGSIKRGLSKYCSSYCSNKSDDVNNKKSLKMKEKNSFLQEKRTKTLLKKYGVTNPMQIDGSIKKIIKTNLEKYGVNCVFESVLIKDKIKKTNLEKYGVSHLSKSKLYHEEKSKKIKNTCKLKLNETIANHLNISSKNINFDEDLLVIKNWCSEHDEFKIYKNNFYSRLRGKVNICTKCHPIGDSSSISEIEISNFIRENLNLKSNKYYIKNKEIDIFIPTHQLGIEYNGLYWHSDKFLNKNYHLNKTNDCERQNIQLLHIFEDEWLFKREIVKSIIKSKLGIYDKKVYGRKCEVREINDNALVRLFLVNNHIQGFVGSSIKIGLFYEDELVSLMSFGKKRRSMGNKINIEGEFEMLRYCNELNTTIIGGASKLLKYFIKNYSPKSITSFADRRYSNGNLYFNLEFKHVKNTEPNYWYFKKNKLKREYRFKYRKDILIKEGFDVNKTEHQIMSERNYLKIYDCGNMKFELKLE